jgi:uncharacterized protein YndB with AHSA1/START domain
VPVRIVERVEIAAPPDEVWAVISDPPTHTDWRPALVEFRQVTEGPLRVGSRIHEELAWRGRTIEIEDEVTAFEPNRRLGIHGGWKSADFDFDLLLEPSGTGTAVTFDWTFLPKSLLMKVAAPFLRRTFQRSTAEETEGLKRYVENRKR